MKTENERLKDEDRMMHSDKYHAEANLDIASKEIERLNNELAELKRLIASDSVYTLLRYGVKSPSSSGVDDSEDGGLYYDLYNISCELRKSGTSQPLTTKP